MEDYASVVFAGFTVISAGWYFIRGRKAFTGPPVVSDATNVEVISSHDGTPEKQLE